MTGPPPRHVRDEPGGRRQPEDLKAAGTGAWHGGKREQNKLANREAILGAAQKVFSELGYDGVTIRDVIRETHLASGTFYNYFPDKESLFRALLEERMSALTSKLSKVRRAASDIEHFLMDAYTTAFGEICEHPEFFTMMFRNEPVVRGLYSDSVMGVSMRALRTDLRDAIARGLLPELDVEMLTAILFGAAYEMARLLIESKRPRPREAAAFATRLFLGGVRGMSNSLVRRGPLTHGGSAR